MIPLHLGRRPAILLALALALLFSLVASLPLVAQAHSGPPSTAQPLLGPHGKPIDRAHPVRVQQVHTHSGRGTDLLPNSVPMYVPPKAGLAVQPHANFPSNCLNGWAYFVIVGGATYWTLSTSDGKYTAWVAYMWCPRWSGDSVGINWSFGKAFVTGCTNVYVGGKSGSDIAESSANLTYDGESFHAIHVCNSYAWDDSLTVIGSGAYKVFMNADYYDINLIIIVQSPCYC